MTQNTNQINLDKNSIFSFLYRNRVVVTKGNVTVMNLSIVFFIFSILCAPWLVVIGSILALVLGYRFSYQRKSADFGGSLDDLVQNAAGKVKSAVGSFTTESNEAATEGEAVEGQD